MNKLIITLVLLLPITVCAQSELGVGNIEEVLQFKSIEFINEEPVNALFTVKIFQRGITIEMEPKKTQDALYYIKETKYGKEGNYVAYTVQNKGTNKFYIIIVGFIAESRHYTVTMLEYNTRAEIFTLYQ